MANRADRNIALKKLAREVVREGFSMPDLFTKLAVELQVHAQSLPAGEERQLIEADARLLVLLEKKHRREFSG